MLRVAWRSSSYCYMIRYLRRPSVHENLASPKDDEDENCINIKSTFPVIDIYIYRATGSKKAKLLCISP